MLELRRLLMLPLTSPDRAARWCQRGGQRWTSGAIRDGPRQTQRSDDLEKRTTTDPPALGPQALLIRGFWVRSPGGPPRYQRKHSSKHLDRHSRAHIALATPSH